MPTTTSDINTLNHVSSYQDRAAGAVETEINPLLAGTGAVGLAVIGEAHVGGATGNAAGLTPVGYGLA